MNHALNLETQNFFYAPETFFWGGVDRGGGLGYTDYWQSGGGGGSRLKFWPDKVSMVFGDCEQKPS